MAKQKQRIKHKQQTNKVEIKKSTPKIEIKEQSRWKWVFVGLAAAIFLALPLMSLDAGNSGDEDGWQHPQSEHLYKYYTSFGKDTSYINSMQLEYSGYAFDAATMFVIKALNAENYMTVRHVMNALMGVLLMLFVGLFARLIGGWRAGCIALLLIFFSPQVLGHSFNNPKDIPFAAFFMGAIYYMAWFIKEFPNPTWKTAVKLGLMIGATIGIRPGGFLLVPYFGLFVLVYYLIVNEPKKYFSKANQLVIKRIFVRALAAVGVMFVVMFILWPYALQKPCSIISSFKHASHFYVSLRQLYEGSMIWSNQLPWYYTLKFILMTSPIAVFAGVIIYLFTARKFEKGNFWLFVLLFCFAFPIFWVAYSKANVYGGWRHSLFAYPTLAVAAALGFNSLILIFSKNKYVQIALTALPLVLLLNSIVFTIKNHPYQYVYFNEMAGGIKKAYGHYELDYYYHSTRAASEWIIANAEKSGLETGNKIRVATWHTASVSYFFRKDTARFEVDFSRWYERGNNDWDYAIFVTTGMNPSIMQNGTYPPANAVHTINVDGVPIASILKRTDKNDYYGYLQMQAGNIDSAKILFKKSLEILPKNESVLMNLANIYLQQGLFDSAILHLNQFLAFEPNNENANYTAALANFYKRDYNQALFFCNKLSLNKSSSGYSLAANIYLQMNDIYSAEKELLKQMDAGGFDQNAANLLMNIYKAQGFDERVAQRKMFKHLAESFRKQGNKELAEQYEAASRN